MKYSVALDKLLYDTNVILNKAVAREDWTDANVKHGYYNGMLDYVLDRNKTGTKADLTNLAEAQIELAITDKEYGKAAYWRAYNTGVGVAETTHRLEVLQSMEMKK